MENSLIQEYSPSALLENYVQAYWSGEFNIPGEEAISQSVLPNGCIELIFHLTADHCHLMRQEHTLTKSPGITLIGLYDTPYEVSFLESVRVFGIRFYPDGFRNIFGVAPGEFSQTYEAGEDVAGKSLNTLFLQLGEMGDAQHQKNLADKYLLEKLVSNKRAFDYTHLAMELIRKHQGMMDYHAVLEEVPISQRQLQREFKRHYGISPLEYMRIMRINAVHNYIKTNAEQLTSLAYSMNFTDQSHMIREFKTFSGTTPRNLRQSQGKYIINPGFRN